MTAALAPRGSPENPTGGSDPAAGDGAGPPWTEAPSPVASPPHVDSKVARQLAAIGLAVAGPVSWAVATTANRVSVVLIVAGAAAVALAVLPDRIWPLRWALIVAAGVVLTRAEGPQIGVWAASGLGLTDWAVRRRRTFPLVPVPSPGAVAPVAVLLGWAAVQPHVVATETWPARWMALAWIVTIIGVLTRDAPVRFGRWLGRVVGPVIGAVFFSVLGVCLVLVPWVAHRIARVDPLDWPTEGRTRWVHRRRRDVHAAHPWSNESSSDRHGAWYRARRTIATAGVVIVIIAGAAFVVRNTEHATSGGEPIPAAYTGEAWYPTLRNDTGLVFNESIAWRPLRDRQFRDIHTRYMNIVDGNRVSWTPPPCDCHRVSVWMYGGSTAFGIGQRDDHTVASELARVARRNGITLDVVNKGIPGEVHASEGLRFLWDLTVEDPPDIVVFYDGVNELRIAEITRDRRDLDEPLSLSHEAVTERLPKDGPEPDAPDGAELVDLPDDWATTPQGKAQRAVKLYDRSRKISRDAGRANGVPVRWFWQPSRFSRPPVDDEPKWDAFNENYERQMYEELGALAPDGVGDLTHAFDGETRPIFTDDVHHNELGARLVARAMYEQLRPELRALVAGRAIEG